MSFKKGHPYYPYSEEAKKKSQSLEDRLKKSKSQRERLGSPDTNVPRSCPLILHKHHELLKHDPERLTTEFLVKLTGCKCIRHNQEAGP